MNRTTIYASEVAILGPTGGIVGSLRGGDGSLVFEGYAGETGPTGVEGPTGAPGATGSQGVGGPTGSTGPSGSTNGALVYTNSINSVVVITIQATNGARYGGSGSFVAIPESGNYDPSNYGYVLTAGHVIVDPTTNQLCNNIWIHVSHPTPRSYQVDGATTRVLGLDKIADVALLRIAGAGFSPLSYKDSRTHVNIGDPVNIIGFPLLNDIQSLTRGVVRDYKYSSANVPESVFTDASIFGGNSGGPVITDDGLQIGILSWGLTGHENMNGAVASYLFVPIIRYFIDNYVSGPVNFPKGYVGISYNYVSPFLLMDYPELSTIEGIEVLGFDLSVPKYFNFYDIITEVQGTRIGNTNAAFPFFTEVHLERPTSTVTVKYRPYISSTNIYFSPESTISVTLSAFTSTSDTFLSSVHSSPYVWSESMAFKKTSLR